MSTVKIVLVFIGIIATCITVITVNYFSSPTPNFLSLFAAGVLGVMLFIGCSGDSW